MITQVATALVQVVLAVRMFRLELPWQVLIRTLIYSAGVFAVLWGLGQQGLSMPLQLALYAPLALVLAVATGLVGRADLVELPTLAAGKLR